MNTISRTIVALLLFCAAVQAQAGLFSLEIVEPAANVGDIGTLQILYHGGEENLSFAVGGLDLKLSSSTAGVIKFLDAEITNEDKRWDYALARDISDNEIGDLFTASLFSPGFAAGGPQVFAEVKYSLLGSGFTNVLLDVGGEDPLYQGDRGDVASDVRSRGICLGDCTPEAESVEINLGDSWALLKEEFERQREIAFQPPSPPVQLPIAPTPSQPPSDPIVPPAAEPEPLPPLVPEVVYEPTTDDPGVVPDPAESVVPEIPIVDLVYPWIIDINNRELQLIAWQRDIDGVSLPLWDLVDGIENLDSSQFLTVDQMKTSTFFTRNGQLLDMLADLDGGAVQFINAGLTLNSYSASSALNLSSLGGAITGIAVPEPLSSLFVASIGFGILCRHRR